MLFPRNPARAGTPEETGENPMSPTAATRDLSAMLRPRSIALVGATDRSMWSRATFANLTTLGYDGEVHLVARRGGIVHGRQAATSCAALGQKIDLGLLMVPAAAIEEAMADLGAAGARNAVILTSGFAETGHDGAAQQQQLADTGAPLRHLPARPQLPRLRQLPRRRAAVDRRHPRAQPAGPDRGHLPKRGHRGLHRQPCRCSRRSASAT